MDSARDRILERLGKIKPVHIPERIEMPPPYEAEFSREELIEKFAAKLTEQTGVFHRAADREGALEVLKEIAEEEKLTCIMASENGLVNSLNLPEWGKAHGITVFFPHDFEETGAYKDAVFNKADAGVTAADFAVAESGTLAIIHDRNNARLLSLAPIFHIAVVDIDHVVPVYETVIESAYNTGDLPSHVTFITGPSMTGDIQGQMFKGMHGPRKLAVILIG
ncbi:MAG: lactate utilization protein [Desulfobacterales bacterium]